MKWFAFSIFIFGSALFSSAQVVLRNDFVLGPHHKIRNKGLSFISINLDRHPNLNMLVNGRGGRSLVIDVNALRHREKKYTYAEIAEKVYTPGPVYRPSSEPVPMFLLLPPPPRITMPVYTHTRSGSF